MSICSQVAPTQPVSNTHMPSDKNTHSDEHGDYNINAGTTSPKQGRCGAVLRHTMSRYGEKRYCGQLPEKTFVEGGSDFCRLHKGLMEKHRENFKTGAFVKSYEDLFDYLPAHKKMVAIDLFRDLMEESKFDFEEEDSAWEIDTSEADWWDGDSVEVEFPLPTAHQYRAKSLWYAALEFIKIENVDVQIFKDAHNSKYATGERLKVVGVNDDGEAQYDKDEHHLNTTLSRMIKDHQTLLKTGGVSTDTAEDNGATDAQARQWVLAVGPEDAGKAQKTPFRGVTPEDTE